MSSELVPVPLLDLRPQNEQCSVEIAAAISRVVHSQNFILGAEVENFEKQIADYCGVARSIGVSSGTDALLVSLMALEVQPGDEIVSTPYSFFATAGSISRAGGKPVFVDIDPESFNINPALIEQRITKKTKAIMPVHLYGQCSEMDKIMQLGKAHSLGVIEDAAQAIGAEFQGRKAGSIGDLGCFSFFPSKNLGAFGDAGLVSTNNKALDERVRKLRVHGGMERYFHDEVGGNFRIDALQAAILGVKLQHLDSWAEGRRQNANSYYSLFERSGLIKSGLQYPNKEAPVKLPYEVVVGKHIFNQFIIRVLERDRLQAFLAERKIQTAIYYPLPLHLQKCFSSLGYKEGDFPESERAAKESLALPIFPELSNKQLSAVVAAIAEFYSK